MHTKVVKGKKVLVLEKGNKQYFDNERYLKTQNTDR